MTYTKRLDGREMDQCREMEAKAGVIGRADGSAMFRTGKTIAYAAVYGPRNLFPRFLQNPEKGILRVNYNMMPFSSKGERVRPGGSRRSKEIAFVTKNALLPALDLSEFPNSVVDVFIELPQTDAGTRCAGINAAAIALADAGIPMKDFVASVSVGKVDGTVVLDLTYDEEAYDGPVADIPIAMLTRSGEVTLLQMDGEVNKEDMKKILQLGQKGINDIHKLQVKVLKEKYQSGE
ncbi:MAG: exosome complex exonuclease Rrp41 [Nanoarchaeota archaeon]|nr:exosome complex exonuclease Rrp41 [Nanoarchaeota archaeon]